MTNKPAINLETPLTDCRRLDRAHQNALKRLGLFNVRDLLFYFPVDYEDFSKITPIKDLRLGEKQTIQGQITEIANEQTRRRRMLITKALINDEGGEIEVIWFQQPYLESYLKPGTYVTLNGKVEYSLKRNLQLVSPVYERYFPGNETMGKILPVYSLTAGITSKWLRFFVKPLLNISSSCEEILTPEILQKYHLPLRERALSQIHAPESKAQMLTARKRFAFEEMFLLQTMKVQKRVIFQKNKAFKIDFNQKIVKDFVSSLPYNLTADQKKAAWQIFQDIEKPKPMNRLLEGEVGSGKTVVAALALYLSIKKGFQGLVLSPTEILANQHFATFQEFFRKSKFKIALLTNSKHLLNKNAINRQKIEKDLREGKIDLLIGTHTLLNENLKAKKLALAIVDEQHRFGVKQRARLKKINLKKSVPHFLSLTATPIPRTLALSLYGDLDLSVIEEMPKNRKKVITKLVPPFDRDKTYRFLRRHIAKGEQVFVVCPLIEESDILGVKAATAEYQNLRKEIFPELKIGLLHGKLKKEEKDKVIKDFKANTVKILVATSVIEVGVDMPNATIIVIEGAERFGLSQLHQFRGRVGRREKQAYCFLFAESMGVKSYTRLKTLEEISNGFELAKKDLELRGPGEVYGIRQSGLPDLKMASLSDAKLINFTRLEAKNLLEADPTLKNHPLIKNELERFEKTVHFE